jgi:hypothetical protein
MSWPSIPAPSYMTRGEVYLPVVRTEFEGGYVQSRKRFSREREKWVLHWLNMEEAHFQLLKSAFITDQGNSFPWTEPVTSASHSVKYSEDSLKWSHVEKGYRQVSVALEEE